MASISTGSGEGGKRAVDHEIPLVPFIDLLLCCIMFLLVTAVWNQLSSIEASLPPNGAPEGAIDQPPDDPVPLSVRVTATGYTVASEAGDRVEIPRAGEAYDVAALSEHLAARRRIMPHEQQAVVGAEDGVAYADLVLTMDLLVGAGFHQVSVSGAP